MAHGSGTPGDPLAEAFLMEAALGHGRDVLAAGLHVASAISWPTVACWASSTATLKQRRAESSATMYTGQTGRYWQGSPEQVDQWHPALHRQPEAHVIAVIRIGPTVPVERSPPGPTPSSYGRACPSTTGTW